MTTGYASVTIDGDRPIGDEGSVERRTLTDDLGCSSTTVESYRLPAGGTLTLPPGPEQVCVPIRSDGPLTVRDGLELPPNGVARVPAGIEGRLRATTATSVVGIGGVADARPGEDPTVVGLDECEFETPSTSAVATARLTARLGCTGMKLNARRLEPGQRVPYHTEGTQEELFVPLAGPATMRIDDEVR